MMKRKRSKEPTEESPETPESPDAEAAAAETEATEESAEELTPEAELAEMRDRYQRTLAEQENVRKRHLREMQDARHYAIGDFARDLLEVVDNLSRAIDGVPEEQAEDPFVAGVQLVQDQLLKALSNHGVTEVVSEGAPFDPMLHNAVMEDERDDVPPGTVTAELVKGYQVRDRLLRAAMVKVSKAPAAPTEAPADESESE